MLPIRFNFQSIYLKSWFHKCKETVKQQQTQKTITINPKCTNNYKISDINEHKATIYKNRIKGTIRNSRNINVTLSQRLYQNIF